MDTLDVDVELIALAPDGEDVWDYDEAVKQAEGILSELGGRERLALELFMGEGCAVAEISERLNLSVSATAKLLQRARARLNTLLIVPPSERIKAGYTELLEKICED